MKRISSIPAAADIGNGNRISLNPEPGCMQAGGYSLLESLITMVVLVIGLLGLAKMGAVAMSHNHSAYLRSQAVLQAHDMTDRMYANAAGVHAGYYNAISAPAGAKPTPYCLTSSSEAGDLANAVCSSQELAAFDAYQWNSANATLLPSGTGSVTGPDAHGRHKITLFWSENERSGASIKSFSFEVEPLPQQPPASPKAP